MILINNNFSSYVGQIITDPHGINKTGTLKVIIIIKIILNLMEKMLSP